MRRLGGLVNIISTQRKKYYDSLNKKEKKLPKYIRFNNNRYVITKWINGKCKYFKSFKTLGEAADYRNRLIDNNWEPLPLTDEEVREKNIKEYYKGIYLSCNHLQYVVNNKWSDYVGLCTTIEEALYLRDLYYLIKEFEKPSDLDLKKDNKYIINGLKYPVPERLKKVEKSSYGSGAIVKKGEFSYHIVHGGKKGKRYYCACRTYEQAYYTRKKLQECNWDHKQLPRIQKEYPEWYTWLMEFYKFIHLDYDLKRRTGRVQYRISIPRDYLEDGVSLEHIWGYNNVEDALYERDWLVANNWDYDSLVYGIDDSKNPYYNMEVPPYPQRKIRNLVDRDYHEEELTRIFELICEDNKITQEEVCERVGIKNSMNLRNWLKKFWNSTWSEFRQISLTGENPINVLEKERRIYQPDLSRPMPSNFKGWVQKNGNCKRNPFQVRKGNVEYGYYPTEAMARKVVKKLVACNWDKSKLPAIKKSVGYQPLPVRNNVYPQGKGWIIRRKNKERKMINYGYYKDKRIAELTRDFLKENNWNKEIYPRLREEAEYVIELLDTLQGTMFHANNNTLIEYNIELIEEESSNKYYYLTQGRYQVTKSVNGKTEYFGVYNTEEEAQEIVEILKLNNWDKTVLTELKGVIL